ncbi:hypothetical protein YN1551_2124 [Sulfolobus islandicus Y.N.15.51]|uniref:Uncharacterized protein n=1 Tax=Saccharolobus islandicus (strain Y.N.15.51 / Yellowstone \|nr:hypothetical protein YN1551_2124 [Sulfolobus islandicus Y.N.15.51]
MLIYYRIESSPSGSLEADLNKKVLLIYYRIESYALDHKIYILYHYANLL